LFLIDNIETKWNSRDESSLHLCQRWNNVSNFDRWNIAYAVHFCLKKPQQIVLRSSQKVFAQFPKAGSIHVDQKKFTPPREQIQNFVYPAFANPCTM
jgi:hypothetical protein